MGGAQQLGSTSTASPFGATNTGFGGVGGNSAAVATTAFSSAGAALNTGGALGGRQMEPSVSTVANGVGGSSVFAAALPPTAASAASGSSSGVFATAASGSAAPANAGSPAGFFGHASPTPPQQPQQPQQRQAQPVAMTTLPATTPQAVPLSDADVVAAWAASNFELGKIPETPPPLNVC